MRLLPLLVLPLFTACVVHAISETSFAYTNPPPRPMRARSVESVEVHTSSAPSRPYTEVGMIRAEGRGGNAMQDAVFAMRSKAASVGCDGVVVTSTGSASYGQIIYNGACFLYAENTTWQPPSSGPGSTGCEAQLAKLRAAPNDAKPDIVQRIPPECLASRQP